MRIIIDVPRKNEGFLRKSFLEEKAKKASWPQGASLAASHARGSLQRACREGSRPACPGRSLAARQAARPYGRGRSLAAVSREGQPRAIFGVAGLRVLLFIFFHLADATC